MDEDLNKLLEPARKVKEKYGLEPRDRINYTAEGLDPEEVRTLVEEEGFELVGKCAGERGMVKLGAKKYVKEDETEASIMVFSEGVPEARYRELSKGF